MAVRLDDIDLSILKMLQKDAKMRIKELAASLGLTYTPVFDRVKKLEKEGYIKGYTVKLDIEKLGYHLTGFCSIHLEKHHKDLIADFEQKVIQLDGVSECYHIAGGYDYLLKIQVKNMEGYQRFLNNQLATLPNISRVQSSFVMSEVVSSKLSMLE